ncbi:ANTAR domain-containing protein [Mycolicibacter terrae]|uniref:Response regulator receiver protein n=2 Tax=Mycolicibacter TaxID=1073531 RepID=A0A1A2NTM5_MYCSD|nr:MULTISPECIES: GAF and ANTAR domain-containing protein [Mycolicibacter]OBH18389.1 response regulator receiver protein [Mycolicibacter sinensis]OBI29387.1 response regulator receiver protein [Mycolicibacter sinensis]RRR48550.1 ANTAR domain-containing protein [Mycolicibacter terrae]
MAAADRSDMMREVAGLVRSLDRRAHVDVDGALDDLIANLLGHMTCAQHAGITLTTSSGGVQTLASTGKYPALLDDIQRRHREGPCLAAAWKHHVVRLDDVTREERWPSYCREVAETTPIRSVLAFELFTGQGSTGALNFYAEVPGVFDDEAVEVGLTLATHAALAWHIVRRDEQFRSALATRDVIGQAKGMLMERFDVDAVQAFELLKRLSQNTNTPLAEVAQQVVGRQGAGP